MTATPAVERAMESEVIDLQKDDHIIFYTDGLEEAHNPEEEMFGRERIIEIARREYGKELSFFLGSLSHELDVHMGKSPQEDDVTVISLRLT